MRRARRSHSRGFRGGTTRLIFAILAFVLMTGCATTAQRQAAFIRENMEFTKQKIAVCIQAIETNPDYQGIAQHMPLSGLIVFRMAHDPTVTQLADNGVPNDEDIKVVIAIYNDVTACRELLIADYMKIVPGIIPTIVQAYHASDLIIVDLIQRKITWGDANKRRMALKDEVTAKQQAFFEQLDRNLEASRQDEHLFNFYCCYHLGSSLSEPLKLIHP